MMRRAGGFTLVEVLVALAIFAILAGAGVAILSFSLRAQAATGAKLDDVAAITRLDAVLGADLAQAVNRPARNDRGDLLPAFTGAADARADPLLQFVRGGWSNLDGAPRASLQKVEYRLVDGAIERAAYPMLDGAARGPGSTMLDHVRAVRLRYRVAGAWAERWDGAGGAPPLPQALELLVTRDDSTTLRLFYPVGASDAPR